MQLSFHVESPLYSASENGTFWNKFNITIEFSKLTGGLKFKQNLYDVIKARNFPVPEERRYSDIKMSVSKSVINLDNPASASKPSITKADFTYLSSPNSSDFSFGKIKMSVTKKSLRIDNSVQQPAPISRSKIPSFSIKQVSKRNAKNLNSTDDEFWDFPKTGKPARISVNESVIDSFGKPLNGLSNELTSRPLNPTKLSNLDNKISFGKVSQNSPNSVKNLEGRPVNLFTDIETPTKVKNSPSNGLTYGKNLKKRFQTDKSPERNDIMTPSDPGIEMPGQEISDSSSRNKQAFKRQKRMDDQQAVVVQRSHGPNEGVSDDSSNAKNSEDPEKKTGLQKKSMAESRAKPSRKRAEEKAKKEQKKEEDQVKKKKEEQLALKKKKEELVRKKKEERQKEQELMQQKKDELARKNKKAAYKAKESIRQQKKLILQKEKEFQHQKEQTLIQKKPDLSREKQKGSQKSQEISSSQDKPSKDTTQTKLEKQSNTNGIGIGVLSNSSEKGSNQHLADLKNMQLDELLEMSIEDLEDFEDSFDNIDLPSNIQENSVLQKEREDFNNKDVHIVTRFYKTQDLDEINVIESSINETPERIEPSNYNDNNLNLVSKIKTGDSQRRVSEKQSIEQILCEPAKKLAEISGLARIQKESEVTESGISPKPTGLLPSPITPSSQKNYVSEMAQKQPIIDESVTFFEAKDTSKVDDHLPWIQPTASQVQVNEKARVLEGLDELRDQVQVLLRGMTNALVKRLETLEKGVLNCDEKFEKWFLKEVGRVEKKTRTFAPETKSSGIIEEASKYEAKLLKWISQRNPTEIS
jgi:hypothetical protein